MSAAIRAPSLDSGTAQETAAEVHLGLSAQTQCTAQLRVPALRVLPFHKGPQPRRFQRVPTHAVGVHPEQREYPRAALKLPLRLRGVEEQYPVSLVTRNISSTGVYFLCPRELAVGSGIQLEVVLVSRPLGLGNVVLVSFAHVRRAQPAAMPGWFGIAASFDDVQFDRDDGNPSRFRNS